MTDAVHYRLDDLRRFATALGVGVGLAPARASALASHLLWYDAAGAPAFGIETLPTWLERVASNEVDPRAEGSITTESLGTAVLDGGNGLAPLILARAGELATEKARDAAVGLVRVANLTAAGPAAGIAAEMAFGPFVAAFLGPGPDWSLALPSGEGLPAVFDSSLEFETATTRLKKAAPRPARPTPLTLWAPWASALVPEGGWLVAALSIKAMEPLSTFHERVESTMKEADEGHGRLLPTAWETRRRVAREQGVPVTKASWSRFSEWATRLRVPLPSPAAPMPPSVRSSSGAM